jgi:uncharacterized membrane protein YfcA
MAFAILLAMCGFVAGGIASVAGFGIGSVLTPLLALHTGTKLAVAAVSIPHAAATAVRLWLLRRSIDRRVLWNFGVTSAAGGLCGALLHSFASSAILTAVFGGLLIFAGIMGLTRFTERLKLSRPAAAVAGALSGLLGGMVGNQGGIRSAAMLGFQVPRHAFVATATATALIVDAVRMPVYLATEARQILAIWPLVLAATAGCLLGTLAGGQLLRRIPETLFRRLVSALVVVLGLFMFTRLGV